MSAPTLVTEGESAWNSATSPKSSGTLTSLLAGDVLVSWACVEGNAGGNLNTYTITGAGLTFTTAQTANLQDYTYILAATAVVPSNGSYTIAATRSAGDTSLWFGTNTLVFRGSDGVGTSNKANATSGSPSVGLTTTGANSAVVIIGGDWTPADGASRIWRSINSAPSTEATYFYNASHFTTYGAYTLDCGASGSSVTGGLSAPTGQKWQAVIVEVLGTAGGGGGGTDQPAARRFGLVERAAQTQFGREGVRLMRDFDRRFGRAA